MNYEFAYVNAAGNFVYKVTFNVYRDCFGGVNVPLDDEITLGVYTSDGNIYNRVKIKLVVKKNVDPPGSIDCDIFKKNVCIEYGFYEGFIEVAPNTNGYQITYSRCCRNFQDNLTDGGGSPDQGQTYYCRIPDTSLKNNSPTFYGVPSPYMCNNDTTSFLFDAIDIDGDSLVYRFMRPYQGGSLGAVSPDPPNTIRLDQVVYKPGYNFLNPFGAAGYIDIDARTAHTHFYSPQSGRFVVGVEVLEYRNGVLLGNIRMDLQILVLDCTPNNAPDIGSDKGSRFTIEAGDELCFNVSATDPDGDRVKLEGRGGILGSPGSGPTISGTKATFRDTSGIPTATSEFCWTPDCDMARSIPYFVYFTAEDDGCPPKFNNLDVEIYVTPFVGAKKLVGPIDACRYNQFDYTVTDGKSKSSFEWEVIGGDIIGASNKATVSIDWSSPTAGSIRVREVSENGCLGEWISLNVTIRPSPPLPVILGKDTVCADEPNLIYTVNLTATNTYLWQVSNIPLYFTTRNTIQLAQYGKPSFTLKVSETNVYGCTSDTAKLTVFVSEPKPTIIGPSSVCPNASDVEYKIDNPQKGSTYTWSILGGVQVSGGSTAGIKVNWGNEGTGEVRVIETNKFGCISTSQIYLVNKTYTLTSEPITGPTSVCEFVSNIPYTTLKVNGVVYEWSLTRGLQVSGDSSFQIGVNWGAAGAGSIRMVQKAYDKVNNKVCLSTPVILNVTINPIPKKVPIVGQMEVCQQADTVIYVLAGFAGSTYEWSINGNSSNILGQGTNQIAVFWNNAGTYILAVKETTAAGCVGVIMDTTVLVNPKPFTTAIIGPSVICVEDLLGKNYAVTGLPVSTYRWTVKGAAGFTGDGTPAIVVDWKESLLATYLSVIETSDKGCEGEVQTLTIKVDALGIDLRYVSVGTPDDRMIIDWKLINKSQTSSFDIQKKIALSGNSWQTVATVSGNVYNYLETNINTDNQAYDYRISAKNQCGTLITSETHTSILLQGIQNVDFSTSLDFSAYVGWVMGVSEYNAYTSSNSKAYSLLESNVNPGKAILSVQQPSEYRKCYRIRAYEKEGENTESWSNEICFFFSPEVFVPNAFTANNDGLNDGFGVVGTAINEFTIKIYNRWGEQLYESSNIDEKWIPTYRNEDVPMGTYIYVIRYTNFENKVFQKKGTINLLR
jgi:gliding motility-associated-like protein